MSTVPTRIDPDIFDLAKQASSVLSRSAAQQINHWARVGRALEMSPNLRVSDIAAVLAGQSSYDDLPQEEQAIVRVSWAERLAEMEATLKLADEFTAAGRTWSEVDDDGNLVVKNAPATATA